MPSFNPQITSYYENASFQLVFLKSLNIGVLLSDRHCHELHITRMLLFKFISRESKHSPMSWVLSSDGHRQELHNDIKSNFGILIWGSWFWLGAFGFRFTTYMRMRIMEWNEIFHTAAKKGMQMLISEIKCVWLAYSLFPFLWIQYTNI